jgi:hypothetical protein
MSPGARGVLAVCFLASAKPNRQSSVRMASVDADHREINRAEFMPQPTRHRASFGSDALGMRRMFAKQVSQRDRIRFHLSLEDYLSHLADDAHRSFPLRDVQPNVLLHQSCSEIV